MYSNTAVLSSARVGHITDLAVTKQASPSTVTLGQVVTYRITVRNISKVTAQCVVVTDLSHTRGQILSVHNPAGTCEAHPHRVCQLGDMKPGATVVFTVRAIPGVLGRFTNRAAVGSANDETNLANNVAQATVMVLAPPPPAGFG